MDEQGGAVMDYRKVEPGLELDTLIAQKVLKWRQDDEMSGTRAWWYDQNRKGPLYLNHFSTDIKAAWDLAEKFRLCVVPWGDWHQATHWTCTCPGRIIEDGEKNAAPTAPHAICLAALNIATKSNLGTIENARNSKDIEGEITWDEIE